MTPHDPNESQFAAAFYHSAIGAAITRPDGTWLRVNRAFADLLGYSIEELQGRTFQSVTHPDDLAPNVTMLQRALAGAFNSYAIEKRFICADGQSKWVQLNATVIRGPDGTPSFIVSQAQDLTERKRFESELRESEQRYAHIAAHVLGLVYQYAYRPDGTHGYTFVSEGARTLFGVDPADAIRDPQALLGLIHRDDWPPFQAAARHAAATLEPLLWEGRVELRSGEERTVQIAAQAERRSDGTVLSNGLITDVTELRRATRQLALSEQRYRSLFEQNPDAVFSFDADGRFTSANPACEALSGYAPDELLGTSFERLIFAEDVAEVRGHFSSALSGQSVQYETKIRHRSGRPVIIGVTNLPIPIEGRIGGVFGIAKNLTVQRELEQQLRQAQKMEAVGRLAGGVAHDFNNLLTVISGYTQMALAELPATSPIAGDLQRVEAAADRASALTRQLLAFSRRQMLKARRVDVNQIVLEATGMLRRLIGEDITIQTELAPSLAPVYADPGQLSQVLMNLAVNSRDAMPNGGTLTLRTANVTVGNAPTADRPGLVNGRYAALIVEDTGTGIDPAIQPHLFEPFYTTKAPGEGTGLGLATVYGIVKQSGGYVYAESTPGHGARFTVLLSATEEQAEENPSASTAGPARGTETILLVEDEAAVREATRRMLQRLGYTVLDAASGIEALGIANGAAERGMRIHLVLTDVVMPGMNGRIVGERLRALYPEMKVLYMSGYTDDEILRRGLAHAGTALLEKPFSMEGLARALREVLER